MLRARALAGLLAPTLLACAHAQKAPTSTSAWTEGPEVQALRAQLAERDQRLNQLESRLALLEASQRELRYAMADQAASNPAPSPRESVRIGERDSSSRARREETSEPPAAEMRPVLRLHEDRRRSGSSGAFADTTSSAAPTTTTPRPLMPVPEVDERLPVAPVPTLASVARAEVAPPPPDPNELYKHAIDLVRQREFAQALQLLNDFMTRYADHPRASKVLFWRGEVLFAQHDYTHAVEAYEGSLAREPRGDKAADALLKISLCHRHLGSPERARSALHRLKTQFPDSDAARLVKEEDA